MKKRLHLFIFFSLILTGYGFQIGRFHAAAMQYNDTHKYTKGLTKRVVAHVNPGTATEKKLCFLKRNINLQYTVPSFDLAFMLHFSAQTITGDDSDSFSDYFSPALFSSGKRGPPSIT